jgi:predicted HTH transcriptional regulator
MMFTEIAETLDVFHHHHNTTEVEFPKLAKLESNAKRQEAQILALFRKGEYLTQPSIRRAYSWRYGSNLAIASCSRAVSNLTRAGKLVKCDGKDAELVKMAGEFGVDVYAWRLK